VLPTATPGSALSSKLVPSGGALFGAFVDRRGGQTHEQAIELMESSLGRRLDIDREYYAWDDRIPTVQEANDVAMGRITLMSWKAETRGGQFVSWASIASGAQDAWITERANAFKAFGHPVMLVFHHEPENDLATNGTPEEFAAAWRHVHDVFLRQGATNVIWVVVLFAFTYYGQRLSQFYPGDQYLDWVGGDGYNFYGTSPGPGGCSRHTWRSFAEVFSAMVGFAKAHGKPAIAAEWGTSADPAQPDRKAAWFRDAQAVVESWPALKALVYFDADRTGYSGCNWTPQTSQASWEAFKALALDPYLNVLGRSA
jgi:beta-mannanase